MDENAPQDIFQALQKCIDEDAPIVPLFERISNDSLASTLDSLEIIPLLLPIDDEPAKSILLLVAKECPPKEVNMAIQEAMERLELLFDDYDSEDDDEISGKNSPLVDQFDLLVKLLSSSIPRLDRRKRTASETIKPLIDDLRSLLQKAGPKYKVEDGRKVLTSILELVEAAKAWCRENSNDDEFLESAALLRSTLETSVESLYHCLNASIAQRSFEKLFSRLTIRSAVTPGWESVEKIAEAVVVTYDGLSAHSPTASSASPTTLFFLAHRPASLSSLRPTSLSDTSLSLSPSLLSSLQTNVFLDEALAILLHSLVPKSSSGTPTLMVPTQSSEPLPSSTTHPPLALLPNLASSHPDSSVRHIAYRILSLLLFCVPSADRLHVLYDLARGDESPDGQGGGAGPAMKVGAIGLIKESIFDGISRVDSAGNVFATQKVLEVLGPVLFRSHDPTLFGDERLQNASGGQLKKWDEVGRDDIEMMEVKRVSECLGLYYAWLMRDVMNVTHIRNQQEMQKIENEFLQPVKNAVERWQKEIEEEGVTEGVDMMPLISLQMNLERVLEVQEKVVVQPSKFEKWR